MSVPGLQSLGGYIKSRVKELSLGEECSSQPLVSCIMPTSVRLDCVGEALAQFLKQDYHSKELLILNDTPGRELITDHPGVFVIDTTDELGLSEKIARLVAACRGELIAFWPEESVSLPWRLSCSVERMRRSEAVGDWPAEYWAYWGREELQSLNTVADWTGLAGGLFRRDLWTADMCRAKEESTAASDLGRLCARTPIPFSDRTLVVRTPQSLRASHRQVGRTSNPCKLNPQEISDPLLSAAVEQLQRRKDVSDQHRRCRLTSALTADKEFGIQNGSVWLDTLTPVETVVGYGDLGRGGELGYEGRCVEIGGNQRPRSLSAHGPSRLEFILDGRYRELSCGVAINDDVPAGVTTADFLVQGDGRPLAIARGIRPQQVPRLLTVDVTGIRRLELVVRPHRWDWCHAVWVDPALSPPNSHKQPTTIVDCLGRAEITLPQDLPPVDLCVATVGSPGYETRLDDLLESLRSDGGLDDALLAVFFFGTSATIQAIAEKHGAIVIPCFGLLPVTAASKAVLYSVAEVIRAERYLCLDGDLLATGDLRPLVAALESVGSDAIFATPDDETAGSLERDLRFRYGGIPNDLSRLVGGNASHATHNPLMVSDRIFGGPRLALCSLDHQLRSFVGAADWVDGRRLPKPARSRFLFNLALAQAGNLVELAPRYLRSLSEMVNSADRPSIGDACELVVREAAVVHLTRQGTRHNPQSMRQLREEFRQANRARPIRTKPLTEPATTPALLDFETCESDTSAPASTAIDYDSPPNLSDPLACAVIISCHNDGRFLGECLDSVLAQIRPAAEILVVLDDCSDSSAEIVATYRDWGVRSMTVRCCDAYLTRRAGLRATHAPMVCFLDADDCLSTNYLSAGLALFDRPAVGIATASIQEVGKSSKVRLPELCDLEEANCVCSAAITRRQALEGTRSFDQLDAIGTFDEDWFVWRRLVRSGWEVARSEGIQYDRRHDGNIPRGRPDPRANRTRSHRTSPSKCRVGFVTDRHVPGGVSRHLQRLIRHASSVEWIATVVADGGVIDDETAAATQKNMPVLTGRSHGASDGGSLLARRYDSAAAAITEILPNVDLLYATGRDLGPLLEPIVGRIPIVYALHSSGQLAALGADEVGMHASELIGVSEACRECLQPTDRDRMHRITNGVDFAQLVTRESRMSMRRRWGLSNDTLAIGFVGRWSPEENPVALAEAVAALGSAATAVYCSPDCRTDARPLDAVERQRVSEMVDGRVVWIWSDSMGEVCRGLDCLVVPSHEEGDSLVAIEALGTGCPLVATPVGMLSELLNEGRSLFVPLPFQATGAELANAIREALSPGNAEMVERARNHALEQWGARRMVREWEAVFQRAAEQSRVVRGQLPLPDCATGIMEDRQAGRVVDRGSLDPTAACAVIVPCHNYGRYLAQCLDSILAQTVQELEIVIVDDASSDDTDAVAAAYAVRGVRYRRVELCDPHEARRTGIALTAAPFVCCIDADDWIAPDYVERALEVLRDPSIGIAWSPQQEFGDRDQRWDPAPCDIDFQNFIHAGAVVRRAAIEQSGAFATPNGRTAEDWETWKRILRDGWSHARHPGIYFYRKHAGCRSELRPDRLDRVIMSTYLTGRPDPQSGQFVAPDRWDLVAGWAEGIRARGLHGVLFHDQLGADFVARLRDYRVDCVLSDPVPATSHCNAWRFHLAAEWLGRQNCASAFLTDLFDVRIQDDPFALLRTDYDLWIGSEPWAIDEGTSAGRWLLRHLQESFDHVPPHVRGRPILNCGIIGGFRDSLLGLLHELWGMLSNRGPDSLHASEMAALNVVVYGRQDLHRVWFRGAPLHSRFKSYEQDAPVCFIHK